MLYADLIRSWAVFYLATLNLYTAPIQALAHLPSADPAEQVEQQQEVWDEWAKQPDPVEDVLFA